MLQVREVMGNGCVDTNKYTKSDTRENELLLDDGDFKSRVKWVGQHAKELKDKVRVESFFFFNNAQDGLCTGKSENEFENNDSSFDPSATFFPNSTSEEVVNGTDTRFSSLCDTENSEGILAKIKTLNKARVLGTPVDDVFNKLYDNLTKLQNELKAK